MARTIEILAFNSNGRKISIETLSKNIKNFGERLESLPAKIRKRVPTATLKTEIPKQVRQYWKENYISKVFWGTKTFRDVEWARIKERNLQRGDKFKLAPMFNGPQRYGREVFGLRTGNIRDTISSGAGSVVSLRTSKESSRNTKKFNLNIQVRMRVEAFGGSNNIQNTGDGREWKVSRPSGGMNYMQHFGRYINKGEGESVFVKLTKPQLNKIGKDIEKKWGVETRHVIETELRKI